MSDRQAPQELLDRGQTALHNGDAEAAVQIFESACTAAPNDCAALTYLGAAYDQANRFDEAIRILTRAVELQPSNAQARYNLATAMERGGHPSLAAQVFEQALLLKPDYAKASEALQRVQSALQVQQLGQPAAPPPSGDRSFPAPGPSPYGSNPPPPAANVPMYDASRDPRNAGPSQAPVAGPPKKGIAGAIAAIGALLLKFKGLLVALKFLTFGKVLLTGGSMFLSMLLWSTRFGWTMAIGIVVSLLIHECGHALARRYLGLEIGAMIFIPFMGAFVSGSPARTVGDSALVAIMGPVAGAIAATACMGFYFATGSPFWLALAMLGFYINLFNMAPGPPLDGGRIAALFSPKLLLPGLAIAVFIFHANLMIWVMAILALPSIIAAWKHGSSHPYYRATARERWIYGSAYLGLAAFLGYGCYLSNSMLYPVIH
ncbi:MAG TPA: tetratricopeptide repeat protein [Chthonomonadaceae bacterium]|nr:tetratricopeptide repeat protein [Chthonomonadaceae bacterium]